MNLARVKPGDPLVIPAETYNAFLDTVRFVDGYRQAGAWRPVGLPAGDVVLVRNDSGTDRARFDALALGAPLISPTTAPDTFAARVILAAGAPAGPAGPAGFCVLLEPAAAGAIVHAAVAGMTIARVKVSDTAATLADTAAGVATLETVAANGLATIVWRETVTAGQVAWAVVRLGSGAGGSASPERLVRVKKTGGAGGNAYNPPSWTYAIYHHTPPTGVAWDAAANQLDPGPLQPELNHRTTGVWTEAADGSLARAVLVIESATPTWHLLDCAEAPAAEFCNVGS